MSRQHILERYKFEKENIVIELKIKSSRQLFNEHDPAPFKERDLDQQFVTYIVSAVEEFPLRTKMMIRILTSEEQDAKTENSLMIRESIQKYFQYEAELASAKQSKGLRTARFFFLIGFVALFICLTLAQLISATHLASAIKEMMSVGFLIIGWVAMWHPIETLLYGWWPIREQRLYFDKISKLNIEVNHSTVS